LTSLPGAVRDTVIAMAATRLSVLAVDDVPVSLRAVARFTPGRRARLGAAALAVALERDQVFRQQVGQGLRATRPELAEAVTTGTAPPAAPVEDLAAAAYLLRPPGWTTYVDRAAAELSRRAAQIAGEASVDAVQRLTEQLEAVRASSRDERERTGAQAAATADATAVLQRKVRELGSRAGRAEVAQRAAEAALAQARAELAAAAASGRAEREDLRGRLAAAEDATASARKAVREGRRDDEMRLRLLLDAVLGAAQGLRRELALAPTDRRPADALAEQYLRPGQPADPPLQGRSDDDPALLDALLAVPTTHLLVDGYNVTKSGWANVSLEAQRGRLLSGLGALAVRTGAEVTLVFDGDEHVAPVPVAASRAVRLLFSRAGETADDVLLRLVRHEPRGRPLVVVSSDREVADGARSCGARPVPSSALLRLLDRT